MQGNLLEALPVCTFCCTLMAPAKCVHVRGPSCQGKGEIGKWKVDGKVKPWKVQPDICSLLCTCIVNGGTNPANTLLHPFSGSLWWEISFMLTLDLTCPASSPFLLAVCSPFFIRGVGLNLLQINNGNRRWADQFDLALAPNEIYIVLKLCTFSISSFRPSGCTARKSIYIYNNGAENVIIFSIVRYCEKKSFTTWKS